MKVYVPLAYCSDYYCDSNHFLGAFENRELAEEAGKEYVRQGSSRDYGVGEYELNERNPDEFKD